MTTRKFVTEKTGPVSVNAALIGHGGIINVQAEADCERATVIVRTTDEDGQAATAVRDAELREESTGIRIKVQGQSAGSGGTTIVSNGGRGTTVVQSFGTVHGTVTGMQIGGNVTINGVRVSGAGATVITGSSPIEVIVVVPLGSSIVSRTDSADIYIEGALATVSADTQSGDVHVERADEITVKTMSGDVRLDRTDMTAVETMSGDIRIKDFGGSAKLKTMSGDITVHATSGGDINARTMSGDIYVTATQTAIDDNLDCQTSTMSGRVRTPQRKAGDSIPRRRR